MSSAHLNFYTVALVTERRTMGASIYKADNDNTRQDDTLKDDHSEGGGRGSDP